MQTGHDVPLAPLTTLRLGGPARRLVRAESVEELVEAVRAADAEDESVLVLGGGSNVVIADEGVAATVVQIATRGIGLARGPGDRVAVTAAAGEPWDAFVARCVAEGLAGVECLAGIPGLVGATPIQNVGAYGQEVADTIVSVRVLDRRDGRVHDLAAEECGFAYRDSMFKGTDDFVVLSVTFILRDDPGGGEARYAELARALGVEPGSRVPVGEAREAVLRLRAGKGMVLDPSDHDTWSAGSFFTNPLMSPEEFAALEVRAAERLGPGAPAPPAWPEADGRVKSSAAWLIERAGFAKGHEGPGGRVALSSKHALAITNRGGASTADLVALARELRDGVRDAFGVTLHPEPVFVGHRL